MLRGYSRSKLLGTASFAALLIGGGTPAAFAADLPLNSVVTVATSVYPSFSYSSGGVLLYSPGPFPSSGYTIGSVTYSPDIVIAGKVSSGGILVINGPVSLVGSGVLVPAGCTSITASYDNPAAGSVANGICVFGTSFTGQITNEGTISPQGIYFSGGTVTGYINSTGLIAGGIALDSTSKLITTAQTGISLTGSTFSGGILNDGMISAYRAGVYIGNSGTFSGGLANYGTITSTNSYGVEVATPNFAGGIGNAGSGQITSSNSAAILVTGVSTFSGGIGNAGTISSGGSDGIRLNQVGTFTGGIVNSGTITGATSGIAINGVTSFDYITNSGVISGATGVSLTSVGAAIVNTGTITGTSGTAIDASAAGNAVTIFQNSGTIAGAVKLSAAADDLIISGGSIAGNIVGKGSSNTLEFSLTGNIPYVLSTTGFTGINQVNINSGNVVINSASSATNTAVKSGAGLLGTGTLTTNLTVQSGAGFAPGAVGLPQTSMAITGNLALLSGSAYAVQINAYNSTLVNVTGTATLAGGESASFATDSYIGTKVYDILHASGGITGRFSSGISINLPSGLSSGLVYTANDIYLNVWRTNMPTTGLNQNQANLANPLNTYSSNGGFPQLGFLILLGLPGAQLGSGLTQASGTTATGSQQTSVTAMGQIMGLMTNPDAAGRTSTDSGNGAMSFADEDMTAGASTLDAYAISGKAPQPSTPKWGVWAAGYGGSQTTDGNATSGSGTSTSRIYGTAVGADYRFSPSTVAGFALAGGGTNFSVANNGSGRSDLFQAGAFVRHMIGSAYITGAVAYGWQDVTTDRTVTIAGIDQLRARFNANAVSGRVEGGYRFAIPGTAGFGLTPYAAAQYTAVNLPAYAESAVSGSNDFALAYAAKTVTDPRSELGLRSDQSFAMANGILTLRGRGAWARDYTTDRSINATFQALPAISFIANGAAQAQNSALATASAEMKWINGWSATATFEGEFSTVTRSYAGKGSVRYVW